MSSFVSDDVAKSCAYGDAALSRMACSSSRDRREVTRCRGVGVGQGLDVKTRDARDEKNRVGIGSVLSRPRRASPPQGIETRARLEPHGPGGLAGDAGPDRRSGACLERRETSVGSRLGDDPRRALLNGWARAKEKHATRRTLHCGMYSGFVENGRSTPSACARSFGL